MICKYYLELVGKDRTFYLSRQGLYESGDCSLNNYLLQDDPMDFKKYIDILDKNDYDIKIYKIVIEEMFVNDGYFD